MENPCTGVGMAVIELINRAHSLPFRLKTVNGHDEIGAVLPQVYGTVTFSAHFRNIGIGILPGLETASHQEIQLVRGVQQSAGPG